MTGYEPGQDVDVWWPDAWRHARIVSVGPSPEVAGQLPGVPAGDVVVLRLVDIEGSRIPRAEHDDRDWDLVIPTSSSAFLRPRPSLVPPPRTPADLQEAPADA